MQRRTWNLAVVVLASLAAVGCSSATPPVASGPSSSQQLPTASVSAGSATLGASPASETAIASRTPEAATASASNSTGRGPADAEGSPAIAELARANVGKTAGTCAAEPMKNSLGGKAFEHSCYGWNKEPEHWCADFAIWVWRNAGYDVKGLNAASGSFMAYGRKHGSTREVAKPGDAVVFTKPGRTTASHVALVLQAQPDGSLVLANGNWGGTKGGDVLFATTSSVKETVITAEQARVGGGAIEVQGGLEVSAIVAPTRPTQP